MDLDAAMLTEMLGVRVTAEGANLAVARVPLNRCGLEALQVFIEHDEDRGIWALSEEDALFACNESVGLLDEQDYRIIRQIAKAHDVVFRNGSFTATVPAGAWSALADAFHRLVRCALRCVDAVCQRHDATRETTQIGA